MKLKVCQNKGTTYLINEMREQAGVLKQDGKKKERNAFLMKILLFLQTSEFSNEKNHKQLG